MRFLRNILLSLILGFSGFAYGEDIVVLHTNQGDIELKMYPKVAPLAVENFTTHVKSGYYNGVIFHRVIKGFMIQGGDQGEQEEVESPY